MRFWAVVSVVGLAVVFDQAASLQISNIFRSSRQNAVGSIKESCIAHAHEGSCQFYVCFEERHPCESSNYALDYGWRFCSRFDTHAERLTADARRWLNGTRRCAMEELLNHYRADDIVCSDVTTAMRNKHAACEAENGLCRGRLLTDNREVFKDVFTLNRRSITHFLHALKHCTAAKFRQVSSWFSENVSAPILPALRDVRDQMREIHGDVMREIRRLRESWNERELQLRDVIESMDEEQEIE